jgi:site-specific DNA recombinase
VQTLLASNRVDRAPGTIDRQPSLLAGILFDAQGERMTPTHATKRGTRYRYYVSRSLLVGKAKDLGQRIPAAALEALVTRRIRDWLADPANVFQAIQDVTPDAGNQKRLIERTKHCAAMWQDLKSDDRRALLSAIVARVQVFADRIDIIVDRAQVVLWLMGDHDESKPGARTSAESTGLLLTLTVPARLRRAGKEMRIVLEDGSGSTAPDLSLLRLLNRANAIRDRLLADRSLTLEEIARQEKMVASYATRLFRLTLLAPNIVGAILNGNQPPELTARKLMDDTRLPLDWNEQRRGLGFA